MTLTERALTLSRARLTRCMAQANALDHTDLRSTAWERAYAANAKHQRLLERHHTAQARRMLNAPPWASRHMTTRP